MIKYKEFFLNSSIPSIIFDISGFENNYHGYNKLISSYIEKSRVNRCFLDYEKIFYINESFFDKFDLNNHLVAFESKSLYLFKFIFETLSTIYECIDSSLKKYSFECVLSSVNGDDVHTVHLNFFEVSKKSYAMAAFVNVQNYKSAEFLLTEYIEKYYLLLNSLKDGIFLIDLETEVIIEANENSFKLLNNNCNLIGKKFSEFVVKSDLKKFSNYYENVKCKSNYSIEYVDINLINNDIIFPVQINISLSKIRIPHVAQVIVRDMSGSGEIEKKKKLLSAAVDQVADSVIITDKNGNIEYVNPSFEKISGYSFSEIVGKNPKILQSGQVPSHYYKLMWDELLKGNVWRGTFVNKKKCGDLYKEKATITPVKDANNNIVNFVAVKRDVTQQIILEHQIQQSQKMQAIGTLAGGIAHDFNNILTSILGYAELSQSQCDNNSIVYNNLNEIVHGAERASLLVDQILKFSKEGEKELSSINLNSIVKEVLRLLNASLPANINIILDENEIFTVKADPTQMYQVIMNLCTNAYQSFNGKSGTIKVGLCKKKLSAQQGVIIGNLPKGTYVCLEIKDDGVGIPSEYINRIFEPYFTTKKLNEGTGLGLSVVHGIVNDHRGAVTVESSPGKGSTFTVYLPESKTKRKCSNPQPSSVAGLSKRILVVDDEKPITYFLKQVLEHLGYDVVICNSSIEALTIISKDKDNFDLMITDMGMPDGNGLELLNKVKKINDKVPVILCTGFSELVTYENYQEVGLDGYVAKPFNADQIAREVYRVLKRQIKN